VLVHTLVEIDPQYPNVPTEVRDGLQLAKEELEAEAPKHAAADPYAVKAAKEAKKAKKARKRKNRKKKAKA
jgi:hypothetical protein